MTFDQPVQIIPVILATSEEEYRSKLEKITASGAFSGGWVQVDLMDGEFVPNKSVGANLLKVFPDDLKIEAHLMVKDPAEWIQPLAEAGTARIIFPLEANIDTADLIKQIRERGIQVGLSVNPKTPVEKLTPFMDKIDIALIMAVEPGFGGQQFIPQTLQKIRQFSQFNGANNVMIEVDGGVNETNVRQAVEAGANCLVIGEHLINGEIAENLEKIWQALRD